jgi:sulfatase modifying factor 1
MRDSLGRVWLVGVVMGLGACGGHSGDDGDDAMGDGGDDAATLTPPSCVGLPKMCGANGTDDCCTSPEVAAGSYNRSYDLAGDVNSGAPSFPATVSGFRLDKYEVTVGRFRVFVQSGMGTQANPPVAGAGAHARIPGSGWDASWTASLAASTMALTTGLACDPTFSTWTDAAGGNENRPINCVTWYEAMAFCAWDGGFLPTEAEWNYAAAGGDQQRAYPWSSPAGSVTIDGTRASYNDGVSCVGDGAAGCALTDLVAVGTKPTGDGRWGQSDLAGNVDEWVLDWLAPYANPCTDCANLAMTNAQAIRGGNYNRSATAARTGHRGGIPPGNRNPGVGVRCAR